MSYTKPFLKWAGGKFRVLEKVLSTFPPGERLVEPFGGSGAVFINSHFNQFLISERNLDLIQLYKQLQQEGEPFIQYCAKFFIPENNQANIYYENRARFNTCTSSRERAALFLYLNRHGYNGLCRYNQKGIYNVPFGSYVRPYFPEKEMRHFYLKSQSALFSHQDFTTSFSQLKTGDIVYCDPPYVSLSKTAYFTSYTGQSFTTTDQLNLARLAEDARQKGHTVIISNHDTLFTRKHYANSEMISFPVQRQISCLAQNGRKTVQELIAVVRPE
jgi:DNA adenine methylase